MEEGAVFLSSPFSNLEFYREFDLVDIWLANEEHVKMNNKVIMVGPFVLIMTGKEITCVIFTVNYIARDCFAANKRTVSVDSTNQKESLLFSFATEEDKAGFIQRFCMGVTQLRDCCKQLSEADIMLNGVLEGMIDGQHLFQTCYCVFQNNYLLSFTFQVHMIQESSGVMDCVYEAAFQGKCFVETVVPDLFAPKFDMCFRVVNEEGRVALFRVSDVYEMMNWVVRLYAWKVHADHSQPAKPDIETVPDISITLEDINIGNDTLVKQVPKQPQSPVAMPRKNVFQVDQETPMKRYKSRDFIKEVGVLSPFKIQPTFHVESPIELQLKLDIERREIESIGRGKYAAIPLSKTPPRIQSTLEDSSLDMQIMNALSKLDVNQPESFGEFSKMNNLQIEEIVVNTVSEYGVSQNIGIQDVINVKNFPDFNLEKMKSSRQPVRPFIDDLAQVIQEIQIRQEHTVRKGVHIDRLCFLVSVVFMNGFIGSDFLFAVKELAERVPGLLDICERIRSYQDMRSQVSAFSVFLINSHALLPVLRAVIRDGLWQETYYKKSAYMNDDETIETMFYMLSPVMNMHDFDIDASNDVIASASPEERQLLLDELPYSYKDFEGVSNDDDLLKVAMSHFTSCGKPCWSFFSEFADSSPERECQFLIASIKKAKWKIDDFEKIHYVLSSSIKERRFHKDFCLMVVNQRIAQKHFSPASSLCDMFRASFIINSLAHLMT